MQYSAPSCHARPPHVGDSRGISTRTAQPDAQWITTTASRRTGPRRWLRAVHWAIAAGHHPKMTATTLAIAEDLAGRMDYDTGHGRYLLDEMVTRLGLSRSCITNHAKYLREAGLLAWVQKGSRTNIRRLLGLKGYAGTATVYAAVIPAAYDHAMGHRIHGTGYEARVVVDYRSMSASGSSWTPSLTVVKEEEKVQVVEGVKDTSRKRATCPTASTPHTTKTKNAGNRTGAARRRPAQVARDIRIAAQVRPRINWTQTEQLRRLAYALRPLIDRGLDAEGIVVELHSWMLTWRPAKPAAFIRCELARQTALAEAEAVVRREQEALEAAATAPNAAFQTAMEQVRAQQTAGNEEALPTLEEQPATAEELWTVRELGRQDPDLVRAYIEWAGLDAAIGMYGRGLALSVYHQQTATA